MAENAASSVVPVHIHSADGGEGRADILHKEQSLCPGVETGRAMTQCGKWVPLNPFGPEFYPHNPHKKPSVLALLIITALGSWRQEHS